MGLDAFVSSSAKELQSVDGIIFPGVGAFGNARQSLNDLQLTEPLRQVAETGKPLFGICLGMQLLFEGSEEFGEHQGLGLISGRISRIPDQTLNRKQFRVPNVGWSRITFADHARQETILDGIFDNDFMYFVHSYCAQSVPESDQLTMTEYGEFRYCSALLHGSILACQFHPEKSARAGLRLYENWACSLR